MPIFNVTQNMTNLVELFPLADGMTQGWLGFVILIVIFFGAVLIFRGSKEGLLAASFIAFVVAPILKYMNLLADWALWLTAAILVVALFSVAFTKDGGA